MNPENEIRLLKKRLDALEKTSYYTFPKDIQMQDGRNIVLNLGIGTKVATGTTQKLGFWGKTPVIQQALTSGANNLNTLGDALAFCNDLKQLLKNMGLLA